MLIGLKGSEFNDLRRLTRVAGKPVLDSGNYRHGFTVTERRKVPAGIYSLVVSTYREGQLGIFNIKVASSAAVEIREID